MEPSQKIPASEIDAAYDKLHKEKNDLQERLDGAEMAVQMANDTIDEQTSLIIEMRSALQSIYADYGEVLSVASVCDPLIEKTRRFAV